MKKSIIFFIFLGLDLKISDQIASFFHMYIYMGERIAGKQDRPSLIIEDPLRAPKIAPKYDGPSLIIEAPPPPPPHPGPHIAKDVNVFTYI